jgi:hypothetical protein
MKEERNPIESAALDARVACGSCDNRFICPFDPAFNGNIFNWSVNKAFDFFSAVLNNKDADKCCCIDKSSLAITSTLGTVAFRASNEETKKLLKSFVLDGAYE